ncbi:hypothetical protein [Atlantibacter hermannii]|uniref:hypothetical protein n=1 Tax=Atlantibacter hermannii TaxID=565 RepID=UPI0033208175
MKDIFLRFINEEQMRQQLINSGFEESEGELFHAGVCLDVVGIIYSQVNSDADNPEYIADEGWHVNIRIVDSGIALPELKPFVVEPKSPSRVWA